MHKQELIHLHGLFREVRQTLEERTDVSDDAFKTYDDHGVAPTAIYNNKNAHQKAIDCLLTGLDNSLSTDKNPSQSPQQLDQVDAAPAQ